MFYFFKSASSSALKCGLDISKPILSYPSTSPIPSSPGTKYLLFSSPTYKRDLIVSICSACVASVPIKIISIKVI